MQDGDEKPISSKLLDKRALREEDDASDSNIKKKIKWNGSKLGGNWKHGVTGLVDLEEGDLEWGFVRGEFVKDVKKELVEKFTITKIQRVQNTDALRRYEDRTNRIATERNQAAAKTGSRSNVDLDANEIWLKHGTGTTDPGLIVGSGLDVRFARPDNWLGRGIYTMENASDVHCSGHSSYLSPDSAKERQMFLVRVAAGSVYQVSARGPQDRKRVAAPSGFHSVRADITVDRDEAMAVVTYSPDQAYPAYLITYCSHRWVDR